MASGQGPARDGQAAAAVAGHGGARKGAEGRGTDLMRCRRSLLPDASRGGAGTGTGSGSGSKGRRSRGTRGSCGWRVPGVATSATCCPEPRAPPPQHVRHAGSLAAALHGAGAKTHFPFFFFFSFT